MWRELDVLNVVSKYLPSESEILFTEETPRQAWITAADLDGDGIAEVAAAYRRKGKVYVLVLKKNFRGWRVNANIKGKGYRISFLYAAPVTQAKKNNLIIGWQVGGIWSDLAIYEWTPTAMKNLAPENVSYSLIDVEDMPSATGRDGKAEIALCLHDTGEAYRIEVYRWTQGKLVPAHDVYPFYFSKVVPYYEQKTKEMPDAAFYCYYLADAQIKAGRTNEALHAIRKGMSLKLSYPSQEEWLMLKQQIRPVSFREAREIKLFPNSVKNVEGVKWGYLNSDGKFIIPPQYDHAEDFQENGLAIVQLKDRSGLIDESGQYIVLPMYQTITAFSEGRAEVINDQGFQVIDEQGKILTTKPYDFIGMYQEGRALFSRTDQGKSLYGYIDRQGREIIPAQYESGYDFKNGKAIVKMKEGQYALIGPNGERLQTYSYAYVGPLGDGGLIAFQQKQDSKYGYMNVNGNVIIPPQFTGVQPFEQERAIINMSDDFSVNRYGLIDAKGNFMIWPQFNDIQFLGENRVAVGKARCGRFFGRVLQRPLACHKNGWISLSIWCRSWHANRFLFMWILNQETFTN